MLEISTYKIAQVILMARELDRAEAELRAFIDRLTEEEQASLVAVMWIGRGSFEADELEEAIRTAAAEATTPTADYLIGSPHRRRIICWGRRICRIISRTGWTRSGFRSSTTKTIWCAAAECCLP